MPADLGHLPSANAAWQTPTTWGTEPGWGAIPQEDGSVLFRIWAPDAEPMSVVIGEIAHPLSKDADGWQSARVENVPVGTAYCYRLADGLEVADPASRAQQGDVTGPSLVVDHSRYTFRNDAFRGRPFEEAIILELHVGTFTTEGTFRAAIERLPQLKEAGITAIELMPVAHFTGKRGWGYDGILQYAPYRPYGTPDDLKALIDAAHGHGMMVFLDVVYNHFGPEGNYLNSYASSFFHQENHTPWGAAIAFELPEVRRFFTDNAIMWIEDYRFDGLRFDATEEIRDESEEHFLEELTQTLRARFPDRYLHLIAEDQRGRRDLLERKAANQPAFFSATWSDGLHHGLHIHVTGEKKGHYAPYVDKLWQNIRGTAAHGFMKGESDTPVPPNAYVNYLQNHDQIGNRAFGERLGTLIDSHTHAVLTAFLLLMPQTPMLFMGEEYGETNPFCFFADYTGELAEGMRKGRVREAENFGGMPEDKTLDDLPDPNAPSTFTGSKLDWNRARTAEGERNLALVRKLCDLRKTHIVPLLAKGAPVKGHVHDTEDGLLAIDWDLPDAMLCIRMNLTGTTQHLPDVTGVIIYASEDPDGVDGCTVSALPGPGIAVSLNHKI